MTAHALGGDVGVLCCDYSLDGTLATGPMLGQQTTSRNGAVLRKQVCFDTDGTEVGVTLGKFKAKTLSWKSGRQKLVGCSAPEVGTAG